MQKQRRLRLAEAVDALLDVADQEKVLFMIRNGRKKQVLQLVCILILIDENLLVLPRKLLGRRGAHEGAVFLPHEQAQRAVGKVVKIDEPARRLLGLKGFGKFLH